jgi:hypothetical protein
MKKILTHLTLLVILSLFGLSQSQAQYYTGIGLRLGKFSSGVSVKYFFDANNAKGLELFAGKTKIARGGYIAKLFYESQAPCTMPLLQIPLDIVFGGGAHAAYFPTGYYRLRDGELIPYGDKIFSAGIDAILGVEYKVPIAPLTLGIDVNPFLDLLNPGPEHLDFSVAIRYIFE